MSDDGLRIYRAYADAALARAATCPFCDGSRLAIAASRPSPILGVPGWHVFCPSCGARGPTRHSRTGAVASWNGGHRFINPILKDDD